MEKGADVRGKEIIHKLVQLAFRAKKCAREHVCVCVYTKVSVSE